MLISRKSMLASAVGIIMMVVLFGCITLLDRTIGHALAQRGQRTLMTPGVTEVYDTSEFSVIATVSAQGLRNEIVSVPKPDGVFRILAFGDSFTFGWGVREEEAWPKKLEELLHAQGNTSVEIINAAAPGMTIDTQTTACGIYMPWMQPDAIVLGVYMSDDLYQVAAEDAAGIHPTFRWARHMWPTLTNMRNSILMRSWHEGKSGDVVVSSREWRRRAGANMAELPELLKTFDPDMRQQYLEGKLNPSIISFAVHAPGYLTAILDKDAMAYALNIYNRHFRRFMRQCARHVPVLVVLIGGDELISKTYHAYRQAEGYDVDDRLLQIDIDTPVRKIVETHGAAFVSTLPSFRTDGCTDCYYPWDMHLTPIGHTRVASEAALAIQEIVAEKK